MLNGRYADGSGWGVADVGRSDGRFAYGSVMGGVAGGTVRHVGRGSDELCPMFLIT